MARLKMALTLGSPSSLSSAPVKFQHASRCYVGVNLYTLAKSPGQKSNVFAIPLGLVHRSRNYGGLVLASNNDKASNMDSGNAERPLSSNQLSTLKIKPDVDAQEETASQAQKVTDDPEKLDNVLPSAKQSVVKRSSLTAREKLRAARVLSKYTQSKPSKSEPGRKILDALRENDKGKSRSGLPEAPSNMFDDGKRGMPKQGLTFDFPGGSEELCAGEFVHSLQHCEDFQVMREGPLPGNRQKFSQMEKE
ncbi:hypothetical protein QJS04_geneDACA010622 [Acorus gramineus]|uniref:Uncharacterized protein n=1 Tax=Acorus gramineus TaxID=55184 RepID=A0AAV9ANM9_ACOGR|nr:hypothetical protein QJS04_geneDACA010622 [Acorus gramineus]